jgi:hypothetical protein
VLLVDGRGNHRFHLGLGDVVDGQAELRASEGAGPGGITLFDGQGIQPAALRVRRP